MPHFAWLHVHRTVLLLLLLTLGGCEGSAPTAPIGNPYATPGTTADTVAAPAAPGNPFGTPAAAPTNPTTAPANPFGGASATTPMPQPVENTVAASTPVAPAVTPEPKVPPRRGPPTQTTPPAPVEPSPTPTPVPQPEPKPEMVKPTPAPVTPEPAPMPENPAVAPAAAVANWAVTDDPGPRGIDVTKTHKLALVKLPQLGAVGPEFVEAGRFRVLYSATPGTAVALGLNDETKHYRDMWDFVAKKKLGTIRNLQLGGAKAQTISPEGKYFAFKPQWDSAVQILEITTGKKSSAPKLAGTMTKLLAFAGPNRLIYEDKGELRVLSVPGFEFKTLVKPTDWTPDESWALSPGGKFLAITRVVKGQCEAEFFDLDRGESAGVLALAESGSCRGLAFSRDGKQLAAWLEGPTSMVKTWLLADGAVTGQHPLADAAEQIAAHESYQGPKLEWFPDGRHLFLSGRAVFDTEGGTVVTTVGGEEKPLSAVRVIGPQQTLAAIDNQLTVVDLSSAMKATTKSIAGTGTPEPDPATEKTGTPADRTGVTLAFPEEVEWTVQMAKPPVPVKVTSRGVNLPVGNLYMTRLSPAQGVGVAMYTSTPLALADDGLPTFEAGTRFWLQPIDLKNGNAPKTMTLPEARLLMSMSANGSLVCLHNTDGLDRLEIVATKDGSREGAFAPYHDAEPGPDQRVTFAEFTDASHLLTMGARRLTHWEFKTAKAVFEFEAGPMRPELSPARDYAAISDPDGRTVCLIGLATGKPEGTIVVSELSGEQAAACAFHPEARWFATLSQRSDGGELRVIDLVDGTERKRFPLPISAQVIQWIGDDYLLLNGSALVSVTRECVVWNYGLPQGMHVIDSPDQRHWYIAADPERSNAVVLRGVDMPDGTALERIGAASPKGRLLLGPDKLVSLDIQVADPPGESGFAKKVAGFLTDRYSGARITVQEKSDVTLTVRDAEGGWHLAMVSDGKTLWEETISGADGPSALLDYEPPKHAFPFGAAQGAGQSNLNVRGVD